MEFDPGNILIKLEYPKSKFQKIVYPIISLLVLPSQFLAVFLILLAIPFTLFNVFINGTDMIDYPVTYILSLFNKYDLNYDLFWAIIFTVLLILFYIELFFIPYLILGLMAEKKYIKKNQNEYVENYTSKNIKYKLPLNKKIGITLYSIWFALTFLFFKSSIIQFVKHLIKHIKFDNLFGIRGGWIAFIFILLTACAGFWFYNEKKE